MDAKITEVEKKAFERNEEKLWDLTAVTSIPSLFIQLCVSKFCDEKDVYKIAAEDSYKLADALILERRKRLKSTGPETSGVG